MSLDSFVKTFFSLVITLALIATIPKSSIQNPGTQDELTAVTDALPLNFELNQGQTHKRVKFIARSAGYVLFLTPTEAVMALDNPAAHRKGKEDLDARDSKESKPPRSIVRMKLKGANPACQIEGLDQLAARSNYFAGPDPAAWQTDIPNYARVRYAQVYPGIDMVYYGDERRLEYDFIVAPGSDPEMIEVAFGGIQNFEISRMGDLILHTPQGDVRQRKPAAYQEVNGVKAEVPVSYVAKNGHNIGFQLGDYDPDRPLIIDPVLIYSTYLGGSGFDQGYAIAVDSLGNSYITGQTAAIDFPTTTGAFQTEYGGGDTFVAKLNPSGNALVYSTYLASSSGNGIAVDAAGNAYVTAMLDQRAFLRQQVHSKPRRWVTTPL